MTPSSFSSSALALLAQEQDFRPKTLHKANALAPDQELCFVCLRWTTDAPECRGDFHGCDLQPVEATTPAAAVAVH